MDRLILRNKTLYWICAAMACLQGLLCVNQITQGGSIVRSAYDMMYYDMTGLTVIWGAFTVLAGLVAMAGFIVSGIGAFMRNLVTTGVGCIILAVSYVLAMIRELIGAFLYNGIGFFFLNLIGLAITIVLVIIAFSGSGTLKDLILRHTVPAMMVPMGLFVLTLIVAAAGYGLSAGTFFYNFAEDLALTAIIVVIGALLAEAAPNVTEDSERSADMSYRSDSPFDQRGSVQPPDGYRSVALVIIFGLITCGIYLFYWVYKVSEKINAELMTGKSPAAQMLLFMFVPFYSWYWIYTMSRDINEYSSRQGRNPDSVLRVVNLIVAIIGFSIVSIAIMQDMINKAVGETAGSYYSRSGYGYAGQQAHAGGAHPAGEETESQAQAQAQADQTGNGASYSYENTDVGAGYYYAGAQARAEEAAPEAAYEAAGDAAEAAPEAAPEETDADSFEMVDKPEAAEEESVHEFVHEEEGEYEVMDQQETGKLDQSIYDLVNELEKEQSPFETEQPQEQVSSPEKVPYDELKKLKALLDEGIITEEEFERMKKKFI